MKSFHHYLRAAAAYLSMVVAFSGSALAQQASCGVLEKQTRASEVYVTIDRNGVIGNGFSGTWVPGVCSDGRYSSLQFPRSSGVEHLQYGGVWMGGRSRQRRALGVSTGAYNVSRAYQVGSRDFEFFAPANGTMREISNDRASGNLYRPEALSTQDFYTTFADTAAIFVPGTQIRIDNTDRAPLGLAVDMATYNWSLSATRNFIIMDFKVRNVGRDTISNFMAAYWFEGVVRNINVVQPTAGTAFYNKGGNGYIDSLDIAYEFDANPDPNNEERANSYIGIKYLGGRYLDTLRDANGFVRRNADGSLIRNADGSLRREWVYAHKQNPYFRNATNPNIRNRFQPMWRTWFFSNPPRQVYSRPANDAIRYQFMTRGFNAFGAGSANDSLTPAQVLVDNQTQGNRSSLISAGPFGDLLPGDTLTFSFALVCAPKVEDGNGLWLDTDRQRSLLATAASRVQTVYQGGDLNYDGQLDPGADPNAGRFLLPSPPDSPKDTVIARNNKIEIYWTDRAERSIDRLTRQRDFEGYRIYASKFAFDVTPRTNETNLRAVAEWDKEGNNLFADNGFRNIRLAQPWIVNGDTFVYRYVMDNVPNGWQQQVAVTAFDSGDPATNLESEESSIQSTLRSVFPGTEANGALKNNEPYVYPNPYYLNASWEGRVTQGSSTNRRLMFANLPNRAKIRILNSAGDLIDEIVHEGGQNGGDISWYRTNTELNRNVIARGEHAWDIISSYNQIIAGGLFLFTVEDLDSGERYTGKFSVVK